VHARGKRLELAGWVWVVGKHARVRSSIYMYFTGWECMYVSRGEWKGNLHDSKYGTETKWVGRVN
jgi:hypothetical protein